MRPLVWILSLEGKKGNEGKNKTCLSWIFVSTTSITETWIGKFTDNGCSKSERRRIKCGEEEHLETEARTKGICTGWLLRLNEQLHKLQIRVLNLSCASLLVEALTCCCQIMHMIILSFFFFSFARSIGCFIQLLSVVYLSFIGTSSSWRTRYILCIIQYFS